MKTINISQTVTIPDGIKCSVKARTVTVTGPRGSLVKSFRHLKVDISKVDKKTLKVEKWFGLRKELAAVRTICSHITNMIVGVTKVGAAAFLPLACAFYICTLVEFQISVEDGSARPKSRSFNPGC